MVTGAAGFIGSHLCTALCARGYFVTGLDNFSTGKMSNLTRLDNNSNFKLITGDIRKRKDCIVALKNQDAVLHQAALGSVPRSLIDPLTTNDVNVGGFLNMLKNSIDQGVDRFIYAASSSTYGDSTALPKVEAVIGNPLSPYAITKLVNELYADVFHKAYGIDTIGLRYFNVFGPYQDPDGAYAAVIPKFVRRFTNLDPITINGDGSYSRDFTFIDNVVQANIRSLETKNPAALNQVYNIACGERTTIESLAIGIRSKLSKFNPKIAEVPIEYGTLRGGDVPHSLASIEKAQKLLGYLPEFDIQDGLERSIQWYWENL